MSAECYFTNGWLYKNAKILLGWVKGFLAAQVAAKK
jgi:hypothetical protein